MADMPRAGERVELLELDDAWLVDPASGREGRGSLRVEDGVIVAVDWASDEPEAWPVSGRAGARTRANRPAVLVAPAFIDIHVHLRQPGREDAETIATGLAAAAHGGFGTVCAMANTTPPIDTAGLVEDELATARASGSPVRLLPYATITAGRRGETLSHMGEMADAGAVGFSDDGAPVGDASLFRNALAYAGALARMLVEHAEEPALVKGAEANEGMMSTVLGLKGWPVAAEESAVARDLALLAEVAATYPASAAPHLHLTHLSTAGSVELVRRARAAGLPVTCDVTPHHLAFHEGWVAGDRRFAWDAADSPWAGGPADAAPFDPSTRVNPPLRSPATQPSWNARWCGVTSQVTGSPAARARRTSSTEPAVERWVRCRCGAAEAGYVATTSARRARSRATALSSAATGQPFSPSTVDIMPSLASAPFTSAGSSACSTSMRPSAPAYASALRNSEASPTGAPSSLKPTAPASAISPMWESVSPLRPAVIVP